MSRGAWMPIRTFSPMIDRTETSMSSPIMIDWLDLRVSTSIVAVSLPGSERTADAIPASAASNESRSRLALFDAVAMGPAPETA